MATNIALLSAWDLCAPWETCVGLTCTWAQKRIALDGTLWTSTAGAASPPLSHCRRQRWPILPEGADERGNQERLSVWTWPAPSKANSPGLELSGKFLFNSLGVKSCPPGSTVIKDIRTCEEASASSGYPLLLQLSTGEEPSSVCNWCGGCQPQVIRLYSESGSLVKYICLKDSFGDPVTSPAAIQPAAAQPGAAAQLAGSHAQNLSWHKVINNCTSIIPTRLAFLENTRPEAHGWTSRVNGMLGAAPYALAHGYGLQFSSHTCALEDRSSPHCFFQPLFEGCPFVRHMCTQLGILNRRPSYVERWTASACKMLSHPSNPDCDGNRLSAWRIIAQALLVPQPDIVRYVEQHYLRFIFQGWQDALYSGHYGAIHVRRTDKKLETERFYHTCRYLEKLAEVSANATSISIFIASDDIETVIAEWQQCSLVKQLGWFPQFFARKPDRGFLRKELYRVWAEISLLVQAKWCVGTFSSNIGILVQMLRSRPENTMVSLDSVWLPPNRGMSVMLSNMR